MLQVLILVVVLAAGSGMGHAVPHPVPVRLLVPLIRGDELGRLMPLAPGAQLVQHGGKPYVLVARFRDRRAAGQAGQRLRARLRLPYVLDPPPPAAHRANLLGGPMVLSDVLPAAATH